MDETNKLILKRYEITKDEEIFVHYNLNPLEKIKELLSETEKAELLSLTNNVLLSSNFSYKSYMAQQRRKFIGEIIKTNLFYFLIFGKILQFIYSSNKEKSNETPAFWKRFLLLNIPLFLVLMFYRYRKIKKINSFVHNLFIYLSEIFIYQYNHNSNNILLAKLNPENYDINLDKKNEISEKKENLPLYTCKEVALSNKEIFYNSVISYANGCFGNFFYNNLPENEQKLYEDIFKLINEVEIKLKEENRIIRIVSTLTHNLFCSSANSFDVKKALVLKIIDFIIDDLYFKDYSLINQRKKLMKEKKEEFNKKIMPDGYFVEINDDVILLFKIKEKYKSFDQYYNILCDEMEKIFKSNLYSP